MVAGPIVIDLAALTGFATDLPSETGSGSVIGSHEDWIFGGLEART